MQLPRPFESKAETGLCKQQAFQAIAPWAGGLMAGKHCRYTGGVGAGQGSMRPCSILRTSLFFAEPHIAGDYSSRKNALNPRNCLGNVIGMVADFFKTAEHIQKHKALFNPAGSFVESADM